MPGLEEGEGKPPRGSRPGCCPHLHEAVELVGRRWTGAILEVMRGAERPLRFSEIASAIPDLSDRLLSERVKELEARGRPRTPPAPCSPSASGSPRPAGGSPVRSIPARRSA